MKLYVGTYEKYNNGDLSGEWVTLEDFKSKDEFIAYCNELHKDEEDPELMFQDYEDMPETFYSESDVNAIIWDEVIPLIKKYSIDVVEAFLECFSINDLASLSDCYLGEWDRVADFVEDEIEQIYGKDFIENAEKVFSIDWEYTAERFMRENNFYEHNGHYFSNF